MKRLFMAVLVMAFLSGLTGCISKPYVMTMDRVDQKIDVGNRGYLKGTPPPPEDRGDLKRSFIAVDIDLPATGEETMTAETAPISAEPSPIKEEEKKEEEIK